MQGQITILEQYQLKQEIDKELPPAWGCSTWNTDLRRELRIVKWDLPYSPDRTIVHVYYVTDRADWLVQRPFIMKQF